MRIRKEILKRVLADDELRLRIMRGMGVSYSTVQRWLNENHRLLTTADALEILQKGLGLKREEILERPKQKA